MTKTAVEEKVENWIAKWTNTQQSQILNAVGSALDNALQVSYSNLNIGLKSAMFNVIENSLGDVVRSGRAPTVSEAPGRSVLLRKKI